MGGGTREQCGSNEGAVREHEGCVGGDVTGWHQRAVWEQRRAPVPPIELP